MANTILANGNTNWIILVILGVFLVAMIVMTIIPQKKRQKQQQEMMNSIRVGTKVMTIGRLIGKITALDATANTVTINVGTDANPTLIVIERNGIGAVLDPVQLAPVAETAAPVEDPATAVDEVKEEVKTEEVVEAPAKKKRGKKYREDGETEVIEEVVEEVVEAPVEENKSEEK